MAAGHTTPRESGTGAANRMTQRTNAAPADAPTRTHLYAAFDCVVESDLPLPVTPVETAPLRAAKEVYYEVGAQLAHFADARF